MSSRMDIFAMDTGLQPQILDAIAMIETARAWLGKEYIEEYPADAEGLLGHMEIRLVMHVHDLVKR